LRDWPPGNYVAHCVSDEVDQLDLPAIASAYKKDERGQPPHHPRMMMKLLIFGYCVGLFSSRKIQKNWLAMWAFRF